MLKESILNRCTTYSDPFPHWELDSPFTEGLIKELNDVDISDAPRSFDGTRAADAGGDGIDGKLRVFLESDNSKNLSEAQNNKYQKLIDLIKPNNGDKVLEIGCGWGGFAEYLGKKYDVKLDCITISKKQFEYASNRIFKNGLNEKINIQFKDYRDVKQKYNSIASIEMIEAVGQNYLENYFKTIKTNLVSEGSAAIQAITIDDNLFDRYKTKEDFIQKYIFPGGFLPSKKKLYDLSQNNGLAINQYNSYGLHYSNTLKIWRDEFFKKWEEISKQGFDNKFKRMWHFYLSYCEAGFKSKNIDLIQFSLQNR